MASACVHRGCSCCVKCIHGLHQSTGCVDNVVDDEASLAGHVTHHIHHFSNIQVSTAFVDNCQRRSHFLSEKARAFHADCIGRNHDELGQVQFAKVTYQYGAGEQMIDWNIKETLNLRSVQVNEQGAVRTRGGEKVCNQLGADGDARAVFAILARVAIIRDHHGDSGGRSTLKRVNHHQKLNQILVNWIACRLNDKYINAANILKQLKVDFTVGKSLQFGLAYFHADMQANFFSKLPVCGAAEYLESPVLAQVSGALALGSRLCILCLCAIGR